MKKLVVYIISSIFLGTYFLAFGFCQDREIESMYALEESNVLVVQGRYNDRTDIITVGTKVRYWINADEFPLKGVIREIKSHSFIIGNIEVPLEALKAIKRKDNPVHNFFKLVGPVIGTLGASFGIGVAAIIGGGAESIPPIAVGAIGLGLGWLPIIKRSTLYKVKKYQFQIIDTKSEHLRLNKKGRLEYISRAHP